MTNKKGQKILIHVEDLIEAFPAADSRHTICVIRVNDRDKENSFLLVKDSTDEIHDQLKKLSYIHKEDKSDK